MLALGLSINLACFYLSRAVDYTFARRIVIATKFCRTSNFDTRLIFPRLVELDEFIAKLWDVHLTVKKEGYVQVFKIHLLCRKLLRSASDKGLVSGYIPI